MTREQWLAIRHSRITLTRSGNLFTAVLDADDAPPGMISTPGETGESIVAVGYGDSIETAIADAFCHIEYTEGS
jgi:hypothetical protein